MENFNKQVCISCVKFQYKDKPIRTGWALSVPTKIDPKPNKLTFIDQLLFVDQRPYVSDLDYVTNWVVRMPDQSFGHGLFSDEVSVAHIYTNSSTINLYTALKFHAFCCQQNAYISEGAEWNNFPEAIKIFADTSSYKEYEWDGRIRELCI